jgi:YVTN family beta-propeller protein
MKVLPFFIYVAAAAMPLAVSAQTTRLPSEDVTSPAVRQRQGLRPDANLLFNGWGVTPAGQHCVISDMPLRLIVAPDHQRLLAVHGGYTKQGVTLIDPVTRKQTQFLPLDESWNGLAFNKDGGRFYVSGGDSGLLHVFSYKDGEAAAEKSIQLEPASDSTFLAGIAISPKSGDLYICNEGNQEVLRVASATLKVTATIAVGEHPHSCIFGADQRHLYVSNWGSRNVSVVDTETGRKVRDIEVGRRPNEMALSPDGRLFVACSGDNTVHVIQTRSLEAERAASDASRRLDESSREIIATSLYPNSPEGSTPDGLAVSPDGKTLFIVNADNNDVMVVDISNSFFESARKNQESVSVVEGFIPVGWYPTAVAVSPDNRTLYVANGKGLSSWPNSPKKGTKTNRRNSTFDYIGDLLSGSISFIAKPDAAQMAAYTAQVRRNSPYTPGQFTSAPLASDSVIPDKVGQPCPIKYVLYIIKENRTYDQILGDFKDARGMRAGNGEPAITMYGEAITPNHHQIARDYVLFDNLYCNSEVSVDGHSWCDAAIATDFNERSWIMSYSKHGRLFGNSDMETPTSGYLWDLCHRHGLSTKNYGEAAYRVPSANRGHWSTGRDMNRVQGWISDLHDAEKTGEMPRLAIMSLGEDHTRGTRPGAFTPSAAVASNDQGLGKIVEAASHSRFWKEMAIFVIEDDAQNGPDHVDAHRTVGLVASPYCKRGFVDSTMYSTASMVRTIELILGLPPMTQYDASATPMFNAFTKIAQPDPYTCVGATVDLFAKNTAKSPGAKASAKMNFRDYDLAPEDELNRVLWLAAKGPNAPYPTPIHRTIVTGQVAAAK